MFCFWDVERTSWKLDKCYNYNFNPYRLEMSKRYERNWNIKRLGYSVEIRSLHQLPNMPLLSKIGSTLKQCLSATADFAGEQAFKLLQTKYPDINDVIKVLDQVKDRVKVSVN